jgi:sugar lactone lactonase YvrE
MPGVVGGKQALFWVDISASLNRFDPATINRVRCRSIHGCFAATARRLQCPLLTASGSPAPTGRSARCHPPNRPAITSTTVAAIRTRSAVRRVMNESATRRRLRSIASTDFHLTEVLRGLTISNGLAWSLTGARCITRYASGR